MDKLAVLTAMIVGHSIGSVIAQEFALDYPERTSRLVLIGSFFKPDANSAAQEFWDSVVFSLQDPIDPAVVQALNVDVKAGTCDQRTKCPMEDLCLNGKCGCGCCSFCPHSASPL